jgi:SAM-dependent methyltransferase
MELDKAIVTNIDKLVEEWLINNKPGEEMEMEAVFGQKEKGLVDASTFMAVAQRLRARGFESVTQDDRLSILVPTGLRFSIEGPSALATLQNYCRDDKIQGKPYTVMNKSRHSTENKTEVEDYNFYLKNRIEERVPITDSRVTELLENWAQVDKGFRLIKRWTFKGKGIRIDLSMVRSTPSLNGAFMWQKKFQDRDIFKQPVRYEIEVEMLRDEHTKTKEGARRCLIHGIGEILKAIQKNVFLITKPEAESVLRDYTALNKNGSFRGVQPITMEVKHMVSLDEAALDPDLANVRKNYNVTDKADGLRVLAYCNSRGELFLIDGGLMVYKTGLLNASCHDCLLDGEWVTRSITNRAISHVLLFDIYYLNGVDVSQLSFFDPENVENRYAKMQEWMGDWMGDADGGVKMTVQGMTPASKFIIKLKHFEFASAANPNIIFPKCAAILSTEQEYHTDGLILSPNTGPLPRKSGDTFWSQLKWKPADMNTIDFLVQFEKQGASDRIDTGIDPVSNTSVSYKTLRLLVGSEKDPAYDDPRATILNEGPLPVNAHRKQKMQSARREKVIYQASYFIPEEYPDVMANTCYLPVFINEETRDPYVQTADTKEPIMDRMIVEMRYDPSRGPGWRWVPMRIRHDKTERYAKGQMSRTFNSYKNAIGVWNSIHNPITKSMIQTGAEHPSEEEIKALIRKKRYYNRDTSDQNLTAVEGLRNFHNKWIKELLLYKPTLGTGGKTVLDLACGPGGDMDFWAKKYKPSFVLGVDIDEDNIRNNNWGIYRRYMNYLSNYGRDKVPPMVFVQADSSMPLLKGAAAYSPEDKDILRAVFAKEKAEGPLPPLITDKLVGKLREGADVAVCMFALHYFLKDMATFNGFLENLRDCVKVGGYFIGCCTDGDQVFKLLEKQPEGEPAIGKEGDAVIWSITKEYDAEELRPDDTSVGLPIDVKFISIGTEHREYLVSFDYLKARLDEIGFALLTKEELATLPGGLQHSTNLFENSYKMVPDGATKFPMSDVVEQFSFLSRWFIFKRKGEARAEEAAVAPSAAVEEDTNEESNEEEGTVKVVSAKTAPAASAPTTKLPLPDAVFEPSQIFQFGPEVGLKDPFEIGDDRSPKILAPYWPWPIVDDEDDEKVEYPSLEHYWEAMKLKHGAGKPDLAVKLFSTKTGAVHLHAKAEMKRQGIDANPKSKDKRAKLNALLLEELVSIKEIMNPDTLRKDYKTVVDPAAWNRVKDYHYRRGLENRWAKDALFHTIVEKAREAKKYLLYYRTSKIGDATGELSGVWRVKTGQIEGENKIGRMIMEIANFSL